MMESMSWAQQSVAQIQFAIADPSPVRPDRALPAGYIDAVRMLKHQFTGGLSGNKGMPAWGSEIFSDEVVMARPKPGLETDSFVMYCIALTRMHILYAKHIDPVPQSDTELLTIIDTAHRRCAPMKSLSTVHAVCLGCFDPTNTYHCTS